MKYLLTLLFLSTFPLQAFASDSTISRSEGFHVVWQSINRPSFSVKTRFSDVSHDAPHALEINFARSRGIIDESDVFNPNDPLTLGDALVWLFRTRNVTDDPEEVSIEALPKLFYRYPIVHTETSEDFQHLIREEDLLQLMRLLDAELAAEQHEVSLYAEKFHGKGTAFGETFDMYALTAAHRSFPHNTLVRVKNLSNGKSVVVRINDRGPFVEGRDMDLSLAAFTTIAERRVGKFNATFERLGDAQLLSTCSDFLTSQRRIAQRVILKQGVPHHLALGDTVTLSSDDPFVMRGVKYPNGLWNRFQDFVIKGEEYQFRPSIEGIYTFKVGTISGRVREMTMKVSNCSGK